MTRSPFDSKNMEIYQDIWVNGLVETKGVRECDARYKPIYYHCKKYTRPITMLDIGANLGYYSFRLSSDFNCTSVMIEASKGYKNALMDLIKRQTCRHSLILLHKRLNLDMLQELGRCEHFDIVLALRVVHHFEEPFSDVIKAIASLGDFTFFEIPTAGENGVREKKRVQDELSNHSELLTNHSYKKVGEFPIHVGSTMSPMYLLENPNKSITRPFYKSPRNVSHLVKSTFNEKRLFKLDPMKRGELITKWVPGINLYTYHMLNGIFPDRKSISDNITSYPLNVNLALTDIRPWNFILGGDKVSLIDYTSINTSLGTPFNDRPKNCLHNTALFIRDNIRDLTNMSYNRNPRLSNIFLKSYWLPRVFCRLFKVLKDKPRKVYLIIHNFKHAFIHRSV